MKGVYISLIIVAVLAAAGIGAYFYFTGSPETVAYLNIESGNVQVNAGSGWQAATDQMELGKNYGIKTLSDSQASIVFYESDVMELSPNTEVELAQLVASQVKVNQKSGETWNRVNKLTGTREYTVETPNSVATVRGTGFGVNVSQGGDQIDVDDGTVQCGAIGKTDFRSITEFRSCFVKNGAVSEGNISRGMLMFARGRIEKAISILEQLQMRELAKKKFLIGIIKKRNNLTDENISQFIDDVNTGKVDLNEVERKIPVKTMWLAKIRKITEKIVELNKKLEIIDARLAQMK